jgi:hypothetical protein
MLTRVEVANVHLPCFVLSLSKSQFKKLESTAQNTNPQKRALKFNETVASITLLLISLSLSHSLHSWRKRPTSISA